jgi:hypothetical protein
MRFAFASSGEESGLPPQVEDDNCNEESLKKYMTKAEKSHKKANVRAPYSAASFIF